MDKDINTFSMRLKEWFGWHFPEMMKIVNDNQIYARLVLLFDGNRDNCNDEALDTIKDIMLDEEKSQQVVDAAKISMGFEMRDEDALQIVKWSERVVQLTQFREQLAEYLKERMAAVAPNLSTLIGEMVGSKLISHAGGLTNLAKYPASTIQILGAEKALFRAMKTKGKTPKYGLIFNSSFIGRASAKNKGKISRYLANKCAIASRIDCFSETPTNKFGEGLKDQVEERLKFVTSGTKPRKNKEAMAEVLDELKKEGLYFGEKVMVNKPAGDDAAAGSDAGSDAEEEPKKEKKAKKDKKEKKDKKDKKRKRETDSDEAEPEEAKPKKKSKKA